MWSLSFLLCLELLVHFCLRISPSQARAGDENVATIANRAFDLAFFDALDTNRFSFAGNRHTGDDRVSLDTTLSAFCNISAWSTRRAAFLDGVLGNEIVEFEIG